MEDIRITDTLVIPSSKISFRTSRSAGPGGQNVNKVESRVELLFDPERSAIFSSEQLSKIFEKLKKKIDSKGILHITSQSSRSQWENKEIALQEFVRLLRSSLKPEKKKNPNQAVQGYKRKEAEEKESSFREEADAKEHKSGMNSTCLSPNGIADRFHSYQEKVAGNSRKRLTENFL